MEAGGRVQCYVTPVPTCRAGRPGDPSFPSAGAFAWSPPRSRLGRAGVRTDDPARRPRRPRRGRGAGRAPRTPSGLAARSPAGLWQEQRGVVPVEWHTWQVSVATKTRCSCTSRGVTWLGPSRGSGHGLNACVPPPTTHQIAYVEILTPRSDGTRRWGLQELLCPPEWDWPLLTKLESPSPLPPREDAGRRPALDRDHVAL